MSLDKMLKEKDALRDLNSQFKCHISELNASLCALKETLTSCSHRVDSWKSNDSLNYNTSCISQIQLFDLMDCSKPVFSVYHQLPELAQTHVHHVGDAIQPSHPLSSPSPPAFNLSQHQDLFQWINSSHKVATVLELQHQSFQWIFRIDFLYDWFGLFAVQGILKNLLQQHSSKASILQCSVFFILQLSHPYMTIRKTIALTRWTFVSKVISLLF